jgi:hypothetical protein
MDLKNLKQHIKSLITLEESDASVISCYLNLTDKNALLRFLADKGAELNNTIPENERKDLDATFKLIRSYIDNHQREKVKGIALFYRSGSKPFFKLLQFNVPLPNQISVGPSPYVFNLIELKDVYYRFVVLLTTETSARICEVNLGEITKQVLMERSAIQRKSLKEWSKMHYQHHRKEPRDKFIDEKIKVLDKLMSRGGYAYLIIAGLAIINYINNRRQVATCLSIIIIINTIRYYADTYSATVRIKILTNNVCFMQGIALGGNGARFYITAETFTDISYISVLPESRHEDTRKRIHADGQGRVGECRLAGLAEEINCLNKTVAEQQ